MSHHHSAKGSRECFAFFFWVLILSPYFIGLLGLLIGLAEWLFNVG